MPIRPDYSDSAEIMLADVLSTRAESKPDAVAYRFLLDGESDVASLSHRELDQYAHAIAARIQADSDPADRVLLLPPPGLEFVASFFGCLRSGRIAVPAFPPHPFRLERTLPRLQSILQDARPRLVVTTPGYAAAVGETLRLANADPDVRLLTIDLPNRRSPTASGGARFGEAPEAWASEPIDCREVSHALAPPRRTMSVALLQYTSGSTAEPKGVVLTHANLWHNLAWIQRAFEHTPDSHGVIWLPPYHDMGLIGGILQPMFAGFPVTLMSPAHFLQQPRRWLDAVSRYRATTSGGPNFAYDLCLDRIPAEERASLDLASWKIAFVGAEPIQASTLDRFAAGFSACGFRRETFFPCYGLAEATLMVTGGPARTAPVVLAVDDAASGARHGLPDSTVDANGKRLVGCGRPAEDQEVVVVEPETGTACELGQLGEIRVRGPSVSPGYWHDRDATADEGCPLSPHAPDRWLCTGDLGFFHDGQLFIAGRLKDLIIIDGRNHYPADIEQTVSCAHPRLRSHACAAFAVRRGDREEVVVVAELDHHGAARHPDQAHEARTGAAAMSDHARHDESAAVIAAIRRAVTERHDLRLADVRLIRPGRLPKTTSGKIRRFACRDLYRAEFLADGTNPSVGNAISSGTGEAERHERGRKLDEFGRHVGDRPSPARRLERRLALVTVIAPMLGVLAAIWLAWGHGVGSAELVILASMYVAGVLGVEAGFHRHFAHRAFQAHPALRALLGILGSMAAQGPLLYWAAVHRQHHERSDRPGDPHSPRLSGPGYLGMLRGMWHAHVGWLFAGRQVDLGLYTRDLLRDRLAFWLHRMYPVWLLLGLLLPAAAGGLWLGTARGWWLGFIWGGLVRTFLVHHATWSVNSLCHLFGSRPFATRDESTNLGWLALSSLGGSWHNNHHAFPYSARNDFRWWQIDPAGWLIAAASLLGLAWDIKRPERQAIREYRRRQEAVS